MSTASATTDRRWWVLSTLSIIQLMVTFDVTIMNVALPQAQAALGFSAGSRQWLITAYALAFGSLLLLGGRLSHLWGRRTSLVVGLIGFALASGVGGYASNFSQLVVARAIQGLFAALLAPAALATLTTTFQDSQARSRAFSFYGTVTASGAAAGLILGGLLTQSWSWRSCLEVNVVLSLVALVGVVASVGHDQGQRGRGFDPLGVLLSSGALFGVVFGFANAVNSGWSDRATWVSLVVGSLLVLAFLRWQMRAQNPVLPLWLLTGRNRVGSLVALFVTAIGMFALSLFLAYYLENVIHESPVATGLMFLPLIAALITSTSLASARLLDTVGPRPLVPVGMLLAMMGMILFTRLDPSQGYWGNVLPGLVLTGLGLGLIIAPAAATATAAAQGPDAGPAAAVVSTTQQVGGSIGTALLNTIAVSVNRRYVNFHPTAPAVVGTLHGYAVAFWWAAGFFALGALVTFVLLETGSVASVES